jgi:hypothetical protein
MDYSCKRLHGHARAGDKTSLGGCIYELNYQNWLNTIGTFLGLAAKKIM